jgi:hypothetical protein
MLGYFFFYKSGARTVNGVVVLCVAGEDEVDGIGAKPSV